MQHRPTKIIRILSGGGAILVFIIGSPIAVGFAGWMLGVMTGAGGSVRIQGGTPSSDPIFWGSTFYCGYLAVVIYFAAIALLIVLSPVVVGASMLARRAFSGVFMAGSKSRYTKKVIQWLCVVVAILIPIVFTGAAQSLLVSAKLIPDGLLAKIGTVRSVLHFYFPAFLFGIIATVVLASEFRLIWDYSKGSRIPDGSDAEA